MSVRQFQGTRELDRELLQYVAVHFRQWPLVVLQTLRVFFLVISRHHNSDMFLRPAATAKRQCKDPTASQSGSITAGPPLLPTVASTLGRVI